MPRELVAAHSGALAGEDARLRRAVRRLRGAAGRRPRRAVRHRRAAGRRAPRRPGRRSRPCTTPAPSGRWSSTWPSRSARRSPSWPPATLGRLGELLDPGLEADEPARRVGHRRRTPATLFAESARTVMAADPGVAAVALGVDLVHEFDGEPAYLDAAVDAAAATDKPVVAAEQRAQLDRPRVRAVAAGERRPRARGDPVRPARAAAPARAARPPRTRRRRGRPPPVVDAAQARWLARLAGPALRAAARPRAARRLRPARRRDA